MTEPSAATLSSRRVLRLFVLAAAGAQLLADNQISLAPAFPGLASEREPGPEDFDRIEGEFRVEAALKVGGHAPVQLQTVAVGAAESGASAI
jgi:hypothetical protein